MDDRAGLRRRPRRGGVGVRCVPGREQTVAERRVAAIEVVERLRADRELGELLRELLDREGRLGSELLPRALDAGAVAGPGLLRGIPRRDEEDVTLALGRPRAQDGDRVGLAEAGEVPEVGVLPVGVRRGLDRGLGRRPHDRDGVRRQLGDEALAVAAKKARRRLRGRRGREEAPAAARVRTRTTGEQFRTGWRFAWDAQSINSPAPAPARPRFRVSRRRTCSAGRRRRGRRHRTPGRPGSRPCRAARRAARW